MTPHAMPRGYNLFRDFLVALTTQNTLSRLLCNKLEGMWKEAVIAYVQFGYFP